MDPHHRRKAPLRPSGSRLPEGCSGTPSQWRLGTLNREHKTSSVLPHPDPRPPEYGRREGSGRGSCVQSTYVGTWWRRTGTRRRTSSSSSGSTGADSDPVGVGCSSCCRCYCYRTEEVPGGVDHSAHQGWDPPYLSRRAVGTRSRLEDRPHRSGPFTPEVGLRPDDEGTSTTTASPARLLALVYRRPSGRRVVRRRNRQIGGRVGGGGVAVAGPRPGPWCVG